MSSWVGIDPGLEGALCVIQNGEIECFDTPTYQDGSKRRIDAAGCAKLLTDVDFRAMYRSLDKPRLSCITVTIEKVNAMPKQGVTSTFSFGFGYGVWIGCLAALGIPYQLATPQAWKKVMMAGEPTDKDASRVVCDRLWPGQRENWWPLKKHHGRCDALLIAEYGRRKSGRLDE